MLLGPGTMLARLVLLGFETRWIARKLAAGERFRPALFPAEDARPATWDGVFCITRETFPEVAAKVLARETELRSMSFTDIQQRASAGYLNGATYFDVNEAAVGGMSDDPRFIDTRRLASHACEGAVEHVRGWLYHTLGLSDLFDGGGVTKSPDGSCGVAEYLVKNRPVKDFGNAFSFVDLEVQP
jgi:hypothetical protein